MGGIVQRAALKTSAADKISPVDMPPTEPI
jgi:hypothetical protein